MKESLDTVFYIIPSSEVAPGTQTLLTEHKDKLYAHYEGNSELVDALMIWALVGLENQKNAQPIILVNKDDFEKGMYGNFYAGTSTE